MERHFDVVQDRRGNAIAGASVTIKNAAGAVATIYSDNGVTTTDNPLTTNADGEYTFFAANGLYTREVVAAGYATEIVSQFSILDASEVAYRVGGNAFTGAQVVAFSTLTDGATITPDATLSNHFVVTLAGNRVLANPTGLQDGGIYNFWIKQDGTGSRTLTYGSLYKWPGGTVPTLTTTAAGLDLIIAQYNATLNILACAITKDIR